MVTEKAAHDDMSNFALIMIHKDDNQYNFSHTCTFKMQNPEGDEWSRHVLFKQKYFKTITEKNCSAYMSES